MSSSLEACSPATGDVVIKGGQLNFAKQIDNHHHDAGPAESKALAKLSSHCAFGAFLDSVERAYPPRCSPQTRMRLIGEMKGWATGQAPTSSVMWLTGSAGSGKTALSQTTAEDLKKEGYVLGCHFFYRTSKDGARSDGYRLVPNMVHQMILELPETRRFVEKAIRSDNSIFNRQVDSVFEDLLLKPLLKAFPARFSFRSTFRRFLGIERSKTDIPRLVVVDGLDECNSPEMQILILRTIANAIYRLPIPLRVLIASRPETHIRTTINQVFSNVPLHRINLDEDQDVRKDLEAYYSDRFNQIRREHPSLKGQEVYANWPSQEVVDILVRKSSTQFIFASTVMNYVSHSRQHPVERLEVILGKLTTPRQDRPFDALDTVYTVILLSVDERDRRMVRLILTFIYLAGKGEFSELNLKATPTFLEGFLNLRSGDVARLLDPLVSLLTLPESPSGMISMLHASFFDYFRDANRSGELVMQLGDAHEAIVVKISKYTLGTRGERHLRINIRRPLSPDVDGSIPANTRMKAILFHSSHATASLSLILILYGLQSDLAWACTLQDYQVASVVVSVEPFIGADRLMPQSRTPCMQQLHNLLCSKLGVAKQMIHLPATPSVKGLTVYLCTHSRRTFSQLTVMAEYERDMAAIIVQHAFHSTWEEDLSALLEQICSVVITGRSAPNSKGKLSVKSCVPLIRQLVILKDNNGRVLDRTELLDILEYPDRFGWWQESIAQEVSIYLDSLGVGEDTQNSVGALARQHHTGNTLTSTGGVSIHPLARKGFVSPSGIIITVAAGGTDRMTVVKSRWQKIAGLT